MSEISKIIDDTLKGPNGKYSRKSLTMFTSFVVAIFFGFVIVFSHYITNNPVNDAAVDVFFGFILLSGGTGVLTVWDKIKGRNNETNNEL